MDGYAPLRVHGHHSLLTGVDPPRELLERAGQLGLPALALADVDNLAGVVALLQAHAELEAEAELQAHAELEAEPAEGRGATGGATVPRPIVAAELSDPSGAPGRVVALVEDEAGYRNLCKLVSARQLGRDPGEFGAALGAPEDFDLVAELARHHEGLLLLVDHPRLLIELMGRVPAERVLAAVSPAALSKPGAPSARARPGEARNTHLAAGRAGAARAARDEDATPEPEEPALEAPKVPPPARAAAAAELLDAARAVGCAIVAVPDVYYACPVGERDHRVRVAIKHNALLDDLPDEWLAERPAHLPTFAEMCALYADLPDVPGAWPVSAPSAASAEGGLPVPPMVARTLDVAARCRYVPPLGGVLFPAVELEGGETPYSKLCALAFEGARRRYQPLRPEVVRRLDYELATIDRLGFAPYFLLVQRIADFAKERGIPCVGRGSAADSLVSYCLGLTDADPLRYGLIFERFLNPARTDRPDVDLDFCWRRRDEVIEHVYELFGAERTAMISTLNCFGLRAAFREAALVHGVPPAEVNRWSRLLPHFLSRNTTTEAVFRDGGGDGAGTGPDADAAALVGERPDAGAAYAPEPAGAAPRESSVARAFRATPEARGFPYGEARWQRVLRATEALLDAPRHFGLHPGGVVVAPGPITDFVACQRAAKGVVVTQLDKDAVEAVGLVKMDLLGNRALTVIDDCLRALRERGAEPDLAALPEDDPATAATLREGRTIACFQVESPGMRNLLQQTGADDMDAVIQAVALIRPGPAASGMKDAYVRRFRGLEEPAPPHPRLTDLLWETQGVMLYQEDVMQVAARIAGMDLAEADLLRRALQKRRGDDMEPLAARFLAGCAEQGVARADAARVWELVCNFASFGFCKAHAVTYGRIAYRCVWLKTHHPAVFLAAFLASDTGYYAQRVYVEEARRMGVAILPPDVNASAEDYAVEWVPLGDAGEERPALRIGLRCVKGLTRRTLERLLEERARRGPFLSLPSFLERTGARTDEVEGLVQCGALDGFDRTRPELLWRLHLLRNERRRPPRRAGSGGGTLDRAQLDACRATPESRAEERVRAARARSGGWRAGLGLGAAALVPGETASLFPEPELPALVLPGLPDLPREERAALELELLGLTVHDHPTVVFPCPAEERIAQAFGDRREAERPRPGGLRPVHPIPCARLARLPGARVTLRGWPAATRRVHTSDGRWMRFLTLEDESGLAEVVLFPDVYERDGHRLAEGGTLCITGVVQDQMGACTLDAERIW